MYDRALVGTLPTKHVDVAADRRYGFGQMKTAAQDSYSTLIFWLLAIVLTGAAFGIRMRFADTVMRPDGTVRFGDYDTMRRLARLAALDASETYPVAERMDGFPHGTVSHWTKPFDWSLRVLDPLVSPFVPGARTYESAAVLSGPILGTLCVLLFLAFSTRLLGRFPGLLATAFYALQYPLLIMNAVGNGDHQNLQHIFLLSFGCLWLLEHAGRIGRFAAPLSGVALGLGIWVSTESMVVFLTFVAITGCQLVLGRRSELPRRATAEIIRVAALWLTLLVGAGFEQSTFFAIEWDKVSWFQMYPVAVFLLFLIFARILPDTRARGVLAAGAGLGTGLLGLFLLPGFQATVESQLATFDDVNVWLQVCVNEFRSSFWRDGGYSIAEGTRRFTVLLLAVPVFLAAVFVARPYPSRARITLIALTAITLGLTAWEVKLGHLFAIWFPVVMIIGGTALRAKFFPAAGPARSISTAVFAGALLIGGGLGLPKEPGRIIEISQDGVAELCEFLDDQDGKSEASVIAPWDISSAIMYRSGWPVVASGYHRNIEGIKDGFRYYSSQPSEASVANEILDRRKTRFVVAWYSRVFLQDAQTVLQSGRTFIRDEGNQREFTDMAKNSLFWRLRYQKSIPGYRLRYNSKTSIHLGSSQPEPLFQIYEVKR